MAKRKVKAQAPAKAKFLASVTASEAVGTGVGAVAGVVAAREPIELIMGARLARQLGISAVTFWRWRKAKGFPPGKRIRRRVYFSHAAVVAWLALQEAA
jgi:predicted DNA-binding transcriptional regulator AlpA